MTRRLVCCVLLAMALAGAAFLYFRAARFEGDSSAANQDAWFEDVTEQVGLDFVHDAGDVNKYWVASITGSGAAVLDFDGDGLPDIYLLNFGGPASKSVSRLYKNVGGGKFKDVTAGSGLGIDGYNTGVAVADVNNDGWPDVLVNRYCSVKLFLNNGGGTFKDVTEESELKNPLWGTSANFFDYDRDGWLDLVIVNYLDDDPHWRCYNPRGKRDYCGPTHFGGTVSKLFRNLGRTEKGKGVAGAVRFQDVTLQAGLAKAKGPGMAAYCADFSGDGWPDILIVNDNKPNHLWINQPKNGTFIEEAYARGIAVDSMGQAQAGMGVAVGDAHGDGLLDIYMTHLNTERNTLWKQGPKRGEFRDVTARTGLLSSDWRATGFGTLMADFDQDGWPDIAVVNGGITDGTSTPNPALGEHYQHYSERNQLFRNEGRGKFRDVSRLNGAFCGTPNVARGLACADFDGDGALDLLVTTVGNRARLYRNVARQRGHWLLVQAKDPRFKRDAYGAEVRVRVRGREHPLLRVINPCDSFQSSSDPRAHFGLGENAEFDAIEVLWPDGLAETFAGGPADRIVPLLRGEGTKGAAPQSR